MFRSRQSGQDDPGRACGRTQRAASRSLVSAALLLVVMQGVPVRGHAAPGTVLFEQKISSTEGAFTGTLDDNDIFAISSAAIGDLDGDGVGDLAVGAITDDDGGVDRGAVWLLFLNPDGTVKSQQKISATDGGFTGTLDDGDGFGSAIGALDDLDGDGVRDLAVGAVSDDDGGIDFGAVWILFLNANGTVKSHQKISTTEGGFRGVLASDNRFGFALAALGDVDGDGVGDLAVGDARDGDGGFKRGAVWILFLNTDGTVKGHQKISDTEGGFTGTLNDVDIFGVDVTSLGDLNGDGVIDLAVGAGGDDDGSKDRGAVWILFLNQDGTVKSHQKISSTQGGFTGTLSLGDNFGRGLTPLPDLDGNGGVELAVGARLDDFPERSTGAVWILFLHPDGTVKAHVKIGANQSGFMGELDSSDIFGGSLASLGDLDGDGVSELAVGAHGDDDGGADRGAVWILFLEGPDAQAICEEDLSQCQEDLADALADLRDEDKDSDEDSDSDSDEDSDSDSDGDEYGDEDGDGETDSTDICPGSPLLTEVDSDGCSLEEFCSAIEVNSAYDARACLRSDWRNDQPVRRPKDCRLEKRGTGWSGFRCVAR